MSIINITDGVYKKENNGFSWSWPNTGVRLYVYKHSVEMRSRAFIHDVTLFHKDGHHTPDMCWDELSEALLNHGVFCKPWNTHESSIELPPLDGP